MRMHRLSLLVPEPRPAEQVQELFEGNHQRLDRLLAELKHAEQQERDT